MNGADQRRPAAVVLGIAENAPHDVIFIQRAANLPTHAGQIALPGGGADPSDGGDLRITALREMWEEVGIARERVTIVGDLPPIRARANNYAVTPFVATIAPGPPPQIDGTETIGLFTVPLQTIFDDLRDGVTHIGGFEVTTPVLEYQGKHIWGLTGYVLRSFIDAWRSQPSALRERIEHRLLA
jgi:8-oxo-dGTP pyrophosphatase MutT (NUDIX family)